MDTASRWRERFTRSRIVVTQVAKADRTAGLVTMLDGNGPGLHAWDVVAGVTTPVATPTANIWAYCWLGHDGRYAYVLADENGNELGHLTLVDLRGGADPVDLTPSLAPYTLRGAGISSTGAGLVIDAVYDEGYRLYYLADPVAASRAPRLLAQFPDEAWECRLSADGAVATINTTERNPGVRNYAVRALRTAAGESIGVLSDGPGSSVEAKLFSPEPGGGVRPQLWAGGIAEVATADWLTEFEDANPAMRRAFLSWHGGTPDQLPERYEASSPITYLPNLTAPLLIRQARNDSRVPPRQMEMYEEQARRLGKPVTVLWDDGGHEMLEDPMAYLEQVVEFAAGCVAPAGNGAGAR